MIVLTKPLDAFDPDTIAIAQSALAEAYEKIHMEPLRPRTAELMARVVIARLSDHQLWKYADVYLPEPETV